MGLSLFVLQWILEKITVKLPYTKTGFQSGIFFISTVLNIGLFMSLNKIEI